MSAAHDSPDRLERPPAWVTSNPGGVRLHARRTLIRNLAAEPLRFQPAGDQREELLERLRPCAVLLGDEVQRADRVGETGPGWWSERLYLSRLPEWTELYLDAVEAGCLILGGFDHLALSRVTTGGLEELENLGDELELRLAELGGCAVDERFGLLTSSPRRCGLGESVEIALHLPAAEQAGQLKTLGQACAELGFWLMPLGAPGGSLYSINNLTAQGYEPGEPARRAEELAQRLVGIETRVRRELLDRRRLWLEDRLGRAWGVLGHLRRVREDEGPVLVTWLRLGRGIEELAGPWDELDPAELDRTLWLLQPELSRVAAAARGLPVELWRAEVLADLRR